MPVQELPSVDSMLTHGPRSLLTWIPTIWTQVLFPGAADLSSGRPTRYWLILLLLPGALLYPCLSFYLFEPDEGRYAQIPSEMLARGDWIIPTLQGEPYLDKPPLFYWLVMASFTLFGLHDWAARLVPALAIHGCILLTFFFGRRSLGNRPAFWGALALALAPGFLGMGRLLVLDGVLSVWVILATFSAFEAIRGRALQRGWWLLAAVACGLGVLTKGPVAIVLLVPPLWLHRRLTRTGAPISWSSLIVFGAVVLAVNVPWYLAAAFKMPGFAYYFFWEHNVLRFVQPFAHNNPVWYYVPIVLLGLLPATLLAVPFARFLLATDSATARQRPPALGFFLLAAGWCLLFFTLSECKLPTYILPAFPPLCLAVGCFLTAGRWSRSRLSLAGGAVMAGLLLIANYGVIPWLARVRSPMGNFAEVRAYCSDPGTPVLCYPRNQDSVAFYLGRDDLRSFRGKHTHLLVQELLKEPKTVVLFGHRNSLQTLSLNLPPQLRIVQPTKLGLCDMAVVHRADGVR